MEKQKHEVTPKEIPEQRPDLVTGTTFSNVWIRRGMNLVCVKVGPDGVMVDRGNTRSVHVGMRHTLYPANDAVAYTGPIDDEMMANILIYG